ncbi:DUF4230 domain-containing protein [Neisseria leonii]|uniref:DUF4230 domain-containing protein n=1 Tax=Neisseria leonii TaxID=2995413 RepID=A0A9X4DZY4_9NEIS|nr:MULTISPECIES: DUF4230 domain-containing protein [unclassified Neisseria]MDD9325480.1 DUF4230 domain-containing protein [Neisseria sp. 3986]MDD9326930.1 DUF4230 domain-containing protein [Neisseria sp. 51.81]
MKTVWIFLSALVLLAAGAAGGIWWQRGGQTGADEILTRQAVVQRVQELNRLESTAFYVDTIIRTRKEGSWYRLWQDAQSGLFVVKGRVLAGVDLAKLNERHVQQAGGRMILTMPPAEILSVDLSDLEVYDLKTGSLGIHPIDKSVFTEVQQKARAQVLASACEGGILQQAQASAERQLQQLFTLAQAPVSVYPPALPECKI